VGDGGDTSVALTKRGNSWELAIDRFPLMVSGLR
jgi:hypothetical protein